MKSTKKFNVQMSLISEKLEKDVLERNCKFCQIKAVEMRLVMQLIIYSIN